MPQGGILGANKINCASVISAGQSKKVFLRSSGVRHRKWTRLGVKLPDLTVGMSSHCIIRGYSPSASADKRSGKTAVSLPSHHAIHLSLTSQFLRNVTLTFNLTTTATYFTLCAHLETSRETSRTRVERLAAAGAGQVTQQVWYATHPEI